MKIGITGGSGFIGSYLSRAIAERGDEAIIFSRKTFLPGHLRNIKGISLITSQIPQSEDLEKLDILINLSGESVVGGRWSDARKALLRFSRVDYTKELLNQLKNSSKKPQVFISGSAIGYYGMYEDGSNAFFEDSSPGNDFLAKLCVDWEAESLIADKLGIRTCILRTGIVLSPEAGALAQMIPPFKAFVGGALGSGKQYMSWIHIRDTINAILFLIDHEKCSGVFNIVSPKPLSNEDFSKELADALGRPCFMKVPGFTLELIYGEGADVILKGQKVYPKRLEEMGFQFLFPELSTCLKDLLN